MNHNVPYVKDIETYPGFGFFPNEECLVNIYLAGKNSGQAKDSWPILEIDLCAYEPDQLLGLRTAGCDNYKYFFNRRRYADERNKSYIRRTKTGYWKSTGNPRDIKGGSTKRSLVFYEKETFRGSKAVRTGWIIQEYDNGGEYVIAKLLIKNDKIKKSKSRRRLNVSDDFTENQFAANESEGEWSPITANQFSTNESEGEWSPITATPHSNFPDAAFFNGEGIIFFPDCNVDWSLQIDPAAANVDQSDWFNKFFN